MNLDDLQKQWAVYDQKLDTVLKLNHNAVREATLAKTRQSLVWHKVFIVGEILLGAWFAYMLGSFTASHWGDWKFAVPSMVLHAWTVASIVFVTRELVMLAQVDYAAPIVAIQKKLEARRVARIRFTQWMLLTGTAIWVLWVVVGLKGIWGMDIYAGGGAAFVAINLAANAVGVALLILVSRLNKERIGRSRFLRKIADSLAGEHLPAAMAHLDELARFESDSQWTLETATPAKPAVNPTSPQGAADPARILKRAVIALLMIAALILLLGLGLTHSPEPEFARKLPPLAQPFVRPDGGQCIGARAVRCLAMRDGLKLGATRHEAQPGHEGKPGASSTTIVLVHGLLADGRSLEPSARMLGNATGAEVWTLDMRGHGRSAGRPGDIDYIGQYEDDLADAVAQIRKARPDGKLILAGHSVGGGHVVRYAQLAGAPAVDAYLLFAPHLGHASPTNRGGTVSPPKPGAEPAFKVHDRRLIGLLLLNGLGIKAFNGLPTLYFNMPQDFWLDRYSFRVLRNIGPEDHRAALTADAKPMLVLVGSKDNVFAAREFPAVIGLHKNGKTVIVEGANHDEITRNPDAVSAVKEWAAGIAAPPPESPKPPPQS